MVEEAEVGRAKTVGTDSPSSSPPPRTAVRPPAARRSRSPAAAAPCRNRRRVGPARQPLSPNGPFGRRGQLPQGAVCVQLVQQTANSFAPAAAPGHRCARSSAGRSSQERQAAEIRRGRPHIRDSPAWRSPTPLHRTHSLAEQRCASDAAAQLRGAGPRRSLGALSADGGPHTHSRSRARVPGFARPCGRPPFLRTLWRPSPRCLALPATSRGGTSGRSPSSCKPALSTSNWPPRRLPLSTAGHVPRLCTGWSERVLYQL